MKRKQSVPLIMAGCETCGKGEWRWHGRNAQAVAAKHARKYGHTTWCHVEIDFWYEGKVE